MKEFSPAHLARLRTRMVEFNRDKWPLLLRCDAKAKTTGERCGNPAIKGRSKCRFHGGATGRGADWHKRLSVNKPDASGQTVEKRLARKLKDIKRDERRRTERLAAMTPEERERHEAWHRARKPGPPGPRAARRRERQQAAEIAAIFDRPADTHPASDELKREINHLRALRDAAQHDIFS